MRSRKTSGKTGYNVLLADEFKNAEVNKELMQPAKDENSKSCVESESSSVQDGTNVVLQPMMSENVVLQCDCKIDKYKVSDPVEPLGSSVSVGWMQCGGAPASGAHLFGMIGPRV